MKALEVIADPQLRQRMQRGRYNDMKNWKRRREVERLARRARLMDCLVAFGCQDVAAQTLYPRDGQES